MSSNLKTQIVVDLFISQNFKFSVITGLIIGLCYLGFGVSLILLFYYSWWWKISLASIGGYILMKKIIEIKLQSWLDKLNKK